MIRLATILWIIGLLTIVPYGTYYLLFEATRDQYALLITLVLFWIFGYWGVVGPILGAIKARRVFKAIEQIQTHEELIKKLKSDETEDVIIDLIASENRIPKFIAARVYRRLAKKLAENKTVDL